MFLLLLRHRCRILKSYSRTSCLQHSEAYLSYYTCLLCHTCLSVFGKVRVCLSKVYYTCSYIIRYRSRLSIIVTLQNSTSCNRPCLFAIALPVSSSIASNMVGSYLIFNWYLQNSSCSLSLSSLLLCPLLLPSSYPVPLLHRNLEALKVQALLSLSVWICRCLCRYRLFCRLFSFRHYFPGCTTLYL